MLRTHRSPLVALAPSALAAALLLSGCGSGSDASPSASTIDLVSSSTNYHTMPPAETTTTVAADTEPGTSAGTQEYEIQAGDYPYGVADKFGVTLEELMAVNGWTDAQAQFPYPGEVILIPPGAKVPGATAADASGAVEGTGEEATATPSELLPAAGDNCAEGSYVIQEGDTTRIAVANKFDVTVESLDAANAGTPGYSAFYPGLEIVIPAKPDC